MHHFASKQSSNDIANRNNSEVLQNSKKWKQHGLLALFEGVGEPSNARNGKWCSIDSIMEKH
jgi:hypothetical protein